MSFYIFFYYIFFSLRGKDQDNNNAQLLIPFRTINNPTDYISEEAREDAKKKLAEMEKSGQIPA